MVDDGILLRACNGHLQSLLSGFPFFQYSRYKIILTNNHETPKISLFVIGVSHVQTELRMWAEYSISCKRSVV